MDFNIIITTYTTGDFLIWVHILSLNLTFQAKGLCNENRMPSRNAFKMKLFVLHVSVKLTFKFYDGQFLCCVIRARFLKRLIQTVARPLLTFLVDAFCIAYKLQTHIFEKISPIKFV